MSPLADLPALPVANDPLPGPTPCPSTLALMAQRRSTKLIHMVGPGPSPADVDALVRLASRVPDHGKLAPWRFIVWEGEARARAGDALADLVARREPDAPPERLDLERGRLARAPVVVGVVSRAAPHPKIPVWEQQMSAGAACFALLLGAYAAGFAACWLTEWIAYDRAALDLLGLGADEQMAGLIYLGTPAQTPSERPRPDAAALLTRA